MTYGEITTRLREQMTWLLERHRIQQRIGGPGSATIPVTTTEAKRAELGAEIRQYRDVVVSYCQEALNAAAPVAKPIATRYTHPVESLRHRLTGMDTSRDTDRPLSELLAHRPAFELVGRWQQLARTAVEGERELSALRGSPLTPTQAATILKDTADLVRGLVVLDVRHSNIPSWQPLHQPRRLLAAAEAVARRTQTVDPSVDAVGWRPIPGLIEGPALPGLAGAIQAQHNVAVDLVHFPNALNLRRILLTQADVSSRAARLAYQSESGLAGDFTARAGLYRGLLRASREMGGLVGAGGRAAAESANASRRLAAGPTGGEDAGEALHRLATLNDRVDARICAAVQHGFREKLYFTAIKAPGLEARDHNGIYRRAETWAPVESPHQSELLTLVLQRLRPVPPMPAQARAHEPRRDALANALAVQGRPHALNR